MTASPDDTNPDAGDLAEPEPDWERLIDDVMVRIAALGACWKETASNTPELHRTLARDVYLPALRLLADFCAAVEIGEEEDDDGVPPTTPDRQGDRE